MRRIGLFAASTLMIAICVGLQLPQTILAQSAVDCTKVVASSLPPVFFVTDRQKARPDELYGQDRDYAANHHGYNMHYGRVVFANDDPNQPTNTIDCIDSRQFLQTIAATANHSGVLIFVHGFHVTFKEAVAAAADVARALKVATPVLVYSFPTRIQGAIDPAAQYINDETQASWSINHFLEFLTALHTSLPNVPFTLMSHSLGTRFLDWGVRTSESWTCGAAPCLLHAIVFAGDDDTYALRDTFDSAENCSTPHPDARRFILYVSSGDSGLALSEHIHGHSRAGKIDPSNLAEMMLCNSVDTIDVGLHNFNSDQDRIIGSFIGHFYYTNPAVIADLEMALAGVLPTDPQRKLTVLSAPQSPPSYYRLP